MSVWFTSDPHFGHQKVAELRGFTSTDVHDATLMSQWCNYVKPYDQVWVLGDLCASSPEYALKLMAKLPGELHLVAGNHDKVHPMNRMSHKIQPRYLDVFTSVQTVARRKVAGHSVLLSHFPFTGDHVFPPRHMQYRLPDMGDFLLHGHTHSPRRYTSPTEMHVGVDAWDLTPVPLEEVEFWVKNQVDSRELHYPEMCLSTVTA